MFGYVLIYATKQHPPRPLNWQIKLATFAMLLRIIIVLPYLFVCKSEQFVYICTHRHLLFLFSETFPRYIIFLLFPPVNKRNAFARAKQQEHKNKRHGPLRVLYCSQQEKRENLIMFIRVIIINACFSGDIGHLYCVLYTWIADVFQRRSLSLYIDGL